MHRTYRRYEITDYCGGLYLSDAGCINSPLPEPTTRDLTRLAFVRVHGWLTTTCWSPGITRAKVEKAARNSALVVGAYWDGGAGAQPQQQQVGYCRVVSDWTRFAWLADVFIDPAHRSQGLGRAMVTFALEHPDLADVHYWLLGTKDAHGVYAKLGFTPPDEPQRLMQLKKPQNP